MSTDKDLDKAKASAMDDVQIKESRIPNFTVQKKAGVSKSAEAEAQPTGQKANDIDNIVSMPKLRVLRGGGAEIPEFGVKKSSIQQELDVSASKKVDKKFDANVGVDKDGVNASVGFSMSSSTEVKAGVAEKLDKEQVLAEVQAKGKDGKVPLDELSKVLLRQMGVKPEDIENLEALDAEQRAQAVARISEQFSVALREEKGTEIRGGISVGGRGRGAAAPEGGGGATASVGGVIANEVAATGGALIGGIASLAGGSVRLAGAAAGALGRGVAALGQGLMGRRTQPFEVVSVLPTISEYRVKKVEEAARNYDKAVDSFWKVPPMAAMRKEIEERARQTGLSVPDAMEKMKPGGEWADLHDKFVQGVAASPDAIQSKVAMDKALSSWVRQYDHGTEELLGADIEGNPSHKKAKERIEASLASMEGKTAQTPVFGGESESHAERLKAAVAAIMERIKEFFHSVGQRFSGAEADHATP